jgi:hypothetical protein
MTMQNTTTSKWMRVGWRVFDFTISGPLRAAWAYGSQAAITSASVSLNATFAMSHGILTPAFAWAQAIGFEWTYLRGLATAGQTKSRWVDALNIVAFVSVILYGIMACLVTYQVIPEQPVPVLAFFLALIHILPIGLTGLCSAMIHRVVAEQGRLAAEQLAAAERERQSHIQAEQDALAIESARKAAELASWEAGQRAALAVEMERARAKMQLKMQAHDAAPRMRRNARPERADAERGKCPKCKTELTHAQWLAACRWGHCASCKDA